jgi:hypothetical protein
MASYYRRFIRNFAQIATPLHRLTEGKPKKSDKVDWSPQCEEAFQDLKTKLVLASVLQVYDATKPIVIGPDASDFAIGAVLQQPTEEDPKLMRPVAYFSQNLKAAAKNYAANEREFLAIVSALQEWRCYVEGLHIDLYTDHKPLTYIPDQKRVANRLQRWAEEIQHLRHYLPL